MSKKVLVIEDNFDVRDNITEILELANYDVQSAENGKIGVAMAQDWLPDIIVCDIMMPELDGYGVLYLLSKNQKTSNIPFIFLTAMADKNDRRKGMDLGADDYLTKPFEEMELLNAIEGRLKRSEAFKQEFENTDSGFSSFISEARGTAALQELSENRVIKKYKKKEMIFLEGNYPHAVYLITSGKIKTYKTNDDGKEFITGIKGPGDFIGYLPLLQGCAYQASAMTMEETEVSLISVQDFNTLIQSNRDVAHTFVKMLSGRLLDKESELMKFAYDTVRKRVAEGLLKIASTYENPTADPFPVSREDLANMVGTATESVIRTLSEFKHDGYIGNEGRKIFIKNQEALEQLKY